MPTFEDRERAFESKFALDSEMQFRAQARSNKLLGLWAADLLGKDADAAAQYAMSVVQADFEGSGPEGAVRKVAGDLEGRASAEEIRAKRAEFLAVAKRQLLEEL
jgi:hypothetical protein